MKFFITFSLLFFSITLQAEDITIIQIKRNIQMSETDPVYRDIFLSSGEAAGFKKNMVITVERKSNIKDANGTASFGDIYIPVAQIKILEVYKSTAVAREHKTLSRKNHPVLDQTGIMVGDKINLKDSFIDRTPASETTTTLIPAPSQAAAPAPATTAAATSPTAVAPTEPTN